jgi:hypothetical protein
VVEFDELAVTEPDSEMLTAKIPELGDREGLLDIEALYCAGWQQGFVRLIEVLGS